MSVPPRVLEVFYSFHSGGSERLGSVLVQALAARGWPVTVMATHSADGPVSEELRGAELECHGLDIERRSRLGRRWLIHRLCRRLRPDVLHVQHIPMFMLCYWPARLAGVRRFVVTEHTDYQLRTEPALRARLQRQARHAERITVIHPGLVRYLVDDLGLPADRVTLIPNGIDSDRFAPQPPDADHRRMLGAGDGDIVIGCVARLHPDKDHATLLRAFATLVEAAPDLPVRLVLIGEGDERAAIGARVAGHGIDDRVTLLGDRDDVERLMPQFDVFALASRTEGLPVVLLEAMACGVPCVATAVGGIPALLEPGGGAVVEPGDPDAFAAALRTLCTDTDTRLREGRRARERVLDGYRVVDMVDGYARVLEGKARPA